jgi:hypothetical protein
MGVITLKLDDVIEGRLRKKAAELYGMTRGTLSRAVEDALVAWLSSAASPVEGGVRVKYVALRSGKALLEAGSLKDLARMLKKAGVDPRDVEIRSTEQAPKLEKLGLRVSHRVA